MKPQNRVVREIIDWAQGLGWSWQQSPGGHIRLQHPQANRVVFISATPSDRRMAKNAKSELNNALKHRTPVTK